MRLECDPSLPEEYSDSKTVRKIRKKLRSLAKQCGDRNGYIGYWKGRDYVSAFCRAAIEMIEPLMWTDDFETAFEAWCAAYDVLNEVQMDGSNGEHAAIAVLIAGGWNHLARRASLSDKLLMYDWLKEKEKDYYHLVCPDVITDVLHAHFTEPVFLKKDLEILRKKLQAPSESSWELSDDLQRYRELLTSLSYPMEEYEQWLQDHEELSVVKEMRFKEAREKGDQETIRKILEEYVFDRRYNRDYFEHRKELLELYEANGTKDQVKELLKRYLLEKGSRYQGHISRLRELCEKDEWEKIREAYLEKEPQMKLTIFQEEKLYDRLVRELKGSSFEVLEQYREELKDLYPDHMLAMYTDCLFELEKGSPWAGLYQQMKEVLLVIASLPSGESFVKAISEQWVEKYPGRRAMHRMLEEVAQQIKVNRSPDEKGKTEDVR